MGMLYIYNLFYNNTVYNNIQYLIQIYEKTSKLF